MTTISIASRCLAAAVGSLFLASCGGGGGGGGGTPVATTPPPTTVPTVPPAPVVPPPYALTPATLRAMYVAGYPATIDARAAQTTAFVGVAYIKVDTDSSVIESAQVSTKSDGTFAVAVKTSAAATPGHYAGNVTVNVCKDANCTAQLEGAPFKVPYVIDVVSPAGGVATANLAALAPLAGAGDWNGYQGNAAHTGLVPATLNPAAFTLRWTYDTPAVDGWQMNASELVTGNGLLYFSTGANWSSGTQGHRVFALAEHDGKQAWDHDFGDLRYPSTNPPAFANGKLYMAAGSQESTAMFAFDAASGARLFTTQMASQWEQYLAPVVFDGSVYTEGGHYGGMYAFDATSGKQQWFVGLGQVDSWTPAVDATRTYAYMGNALQVNDRLTGVPVASIPGGDASWSWGLTPLLGARDSVIVSGASSSLYRFDMATGSLRWKVDGGFRPGPAYDAKVVYAVRNAPVALEARNEADGSLAWRWTAPAEAQFWTSSVLLTNNLVFVSTDTATYAIDRTTHAQVWTYPYAGRLALSANGVLYINSGSRIVAINVK